MVSTMGLYLVLFLLGLAYGLNPWAAMPVAVVGALVAHGIDTWSER